jgi:hypothetical protein
MNGYIKITLANIIKNIIILFENKFKMNDIILTIFFLKIIN